MKRGILFSRYSSSIHTINSDYPLKFLPKYAYIVLNLIQLSFPNLGKSLRIIKFKPEVAKLKILLNNQREPISPSRLLSNTLWSQFDFESIRKILGQEIRAIEIGCGSGVYGKKLVEDGFVNSYLGVDIKTHEEWNGSLNNGVAFLKSSYVDFNRIVGDENLFITQSALEHFEFDLKFFRDIDTFASARQNPVIAIHVFPSPACLLTNFWHGIRQYGRYTIGRLLRQNSENSFSQIVALGGRHAFIFHLRAIIFPQIFRKRYYKDAEVEQFKGDLWGALMKDMSSDSHRFATFYAICTIWTTDSDVL
jgi:SAM-dependent methyltransferase